MHRPSCWPVFLVCVVFASCGGHCNPYDGCEPDPPEAGDPCVFSNFFSDAGEQVTISCGGGLFCNLATETCVEPPTEGEVCGPGGGGGAIDVPCADELLCAAQSGLCVQPNGLGADCLGDGASTCEGGLVCVANTCSTPVAEGAECGPADACPAGTVCNAGALPDDPRAGHCLPPQASGGVCAWQPWLPGGEEEPFPSTGCAQHTYCQPMEPPDPVTTSADAAFVSCRAELMEEGSTSCLGLPGRCVGPSSLGQAEPCTHRNACRITPCYWVGSPLGLSSLDGFDCDGADCALFPWPGFCGGLEEYTLPGNGCAGGSEPCPRSHACRFDTNRCVPAYSLDVGGICGIAYPGGPVLDERACIAGLQCVDDVPEDDNYYCRAS